MNDKLEALFKAMQGWGYVPKDATFEEFSANHGDAAKQKALYGFLKGEGKVTMPEQDFIKTVFAKPESTEDVKKKEPGGQESNQQQASSLAPSSSTNVLAPDAGIVSRLDPTAGFPEPQTSVTQIDPGGTQPPQPQPVLDPLQGMTGGPTPEFGQQAQPEMQAGAIGRESTGLSIPEFRGLYQQQLTGNEDIVSFGDELRKNKPGDFESRAKYDNATPYRAAKRKADNAVIYGEEASKQVRAAKMFLDNNFGKGWDKALEEMSVAINSPATPPDQLQAIIGEYNRIVESPEYKMYAAGANALGRAEDAYALLSQDNEIIKVEKRRRELQKKKEIEGVSPAQYYLETSARTGAKLAAGILALPRTLGGALSELTGVENEQGAVSGDLLGSWADQISDYVETEFPKTSDLERGTFERVVPYGEGRAVVDNKGRLQAVYGADGFKKDVSRKEIEEFNRSGAGANAKTEFTGVAGALDKVYEMAGDLFVARGLGAGTKVGTMATTFVQTHADAYNEAMNEINADPNEAAVYATTTAAITSALEAYLGNIETSFGKPTAFTKALNQKDARALMDKLGPAATAMARLEPVIKQVVGENAEEFAQKLGDIYARSEFNERTGADMNTDFTKEEMMETVLLTTLLTAPLSSTQALTAVDDMKRRAIFSLADNTPVFEKLTASMVDAGSLTPEQAVEYNNRAAKIASYAKGLDQNLSEDQKATALAKEWNRMEAAGRSKNEAILPAQADEAKKVASKLEAEIVQDIQVKPVEAEPEVEDTETESIEVEVAEGEVPQVEGVQVGSKTIPKPAAVEVIEQPPLVVEQALPESFRESETTSTTIAAGYSNGAMAATVDVNDPAVRDEIGNIAIQELKQRGYEPSPEESGAIKRFFADSMSDTGLNQKVTIQDAFGMLAEEYMDSMTEKAPLRNRLDVETVDDQIAAFFAGGGKVAPESFDRHGDPNYRKDGSVTSLYFKKGARALDDLANEWVNDEKINTGTLSEEEVINRIVDFMVQYGKKNVNEYLAPRVEAQESAKRKARMRDRFKEREDVDEVDTVAEEQVSALKMTPETESKIDEWLDPFTDASGVVDVDAMREGIRKGKLDFMAEDFDQDAVKRWDALGLEGQNIIESLAAGREVERVGTPIEEAMEEAEEGKSFEEWSQDYRTPDGELDVEKIKAEWDATGEFVWSAELTQEAFNQVQSIVNEEQTRTTGTRDGQRVQGTRPGSKQAKAAKQDQAEDAARAEKPTQKTQESPSKVAERVITETDPATSKQALDKAIPVVENALAEAELPTKLTPELVNEMMNQGILNLSDGMTIIDHLENESEINPDFLQDAVDKIAKLREVPDWLAIANDAQVQHAKAVVRGDARPGALYTANTPDGGVVLGNADHLADRLKRAGAVQQGRAWFIPADVRDAALAEVFGPGTKFSLAVDQANVDRAGSFEGPVTRFFQRQFGNANLRRMREAIAKATSVDEKIAIAKRMTRGDAVAKASRIARALSDKFGINAVMDQGMIAEALRQMGRADLVNPEGSVSSQVRGFFWNDQVYINMDTADTETPIHEFGHVFLAAIKDTPLYAQFEAAIKGSAYEQAVREHPMYAGMSDAEIMEEAMALAVGQRGAALSDPGAWFRFADLLDSLWAQMKALFGIDVQNMKAREFADYMATMVMEDAKADIDVNSASAPAFLFLGEKSLQKREEAATYLASAREMENQGIDDRTIWMSTGWFRGVDGMWRYEIPDGYSGMAIGQDDIQAGTEYFLDEIFDHPDLYEIDPSIGKVRVKFESGSGTFYMPFDEGVIYIDVDGINKREDGLFELGDLRHTLIHEVQHHIQRREGFARGGSPRMAGEIVSEARQRNYNVPTPGAGFNLMAMEASGADAAYRALAGEVEARLAADRKSSVSVTREMPLDAMDITPENQILAFPKKEDTVESLAQRAAKMDPLKAPFITARFLFGRNRVVDAGKVATARQIIKDQIAAGVDPNTDGTIRKLKKELGLSDTTLSKIFAEEMNASDTGRIVAPGGLRAFKTDYGDKFKQMWNKWMTSARGLPKTVFDAKNKWHANVKADFYRFGQSMLRLEDKVKKLTDNNDRRTDNVFQQINNVLTGRQDISTLHPGLHDDVLQIRKELDEMSRNLVLSGAIESREMAFTILRNAGVEITAANKELAYPLVASMRKNPVDRSPAEVKLIEDFLETYGDNLGTYLYRSYRANEVENWKERLDDETKERAREAIKKMALKKMQEEIAALDDKNLPLNDMVEELIVEINGHIDTVKKAIFDAEQELNDILAKQAAYQKRTGKVNKNIARQEMANRDKLKRLQKALSEADAAATLPENDFNLLMNTLGWSAGPINATLRAIYSRRKQVEKLKERIERANAASFERLKYFEDTLNDPDAEIDVILKRDDKPAGILKSGRLGSKDLSVITGRRKPGEELPEEIRQLLGEYTDARINVMRTVYRISNTIEAANFLFATYEAGMREGWLSPKATSIGKRTVQIAPPGSKGMGPLAGMYTTEAISEAINSYNEVQASNAFIKAYFKVRGLIKTGLTVLSPAGQGRNMYSNLMLATSMGWLNPLSVNSWRDFIRSFAAYKKTQTENMSAEMEDAIKRGVVGTSLSAGDLKASARFLDGYIAEGYGEVPLLDAEIQTKMGKIAKGAYDVAQRGYEGTDTLLKLWGFKQEQRKYAQALYGKKLEDLSSEQLDEVKNRAAEVMRATTPDYTMLPKVMELMRQFPFFNTFLAWQMEMYRTTVGRIQVGMREIRDERTRAIGIKRIAGGAAYASAVFGAEIASMIYLGMDDDERDAMQKLMKPWEQNVSKIYLGRDEKTGTITYYTIGQTDPYGFWKKPIIAMYNNSDSVGKSLGAGFEELTKQLIAPELTFSIMTQLQLDINKQTKQSITVESLPGGRLHPENILLQLDFVRKRAQPGFLKPIFDIYDASTTGVIDEYGNIKTAGTILANTLGVQIGKIKPKVAFENKVKEMRFKKAGIQSAFNRVQAKAIDNIEVALEGDSTPEQIEARRIRLLENVNKWYNLMDPIYKDHLQEVSKIAKEAVDVLKIPRSVVNKELIDNQYNEYERAVIFDIIPEINMKRKDLENTSEK